MIFKKQDTDFSNSDNLHETFRNSFHFLNIGEIKEEFNPIQLSRNFMKNTIVPTLKKLSAVPD